MNPPHGLIAREWSGDQGAPDKKVVDSTIPWPGDKNPGLSGFPSFSPLMRDDSSDEEEPDQEVQSYAQPTPPHGEKIRQTRGDGGWFLGGSFDQLRLGTNQINHVSPAF